MGNKVKTWLTILLAIRFWLAGGADPGWAESNASLVKLEQLDGSRRKIEIIFNENKLLVRFLSRGFTLVALPPMQDVVIYRDDLKTIARLKASSLANAMRRERFLDREIPPLQHTTRSTRNGFSYTERIYSGGGKDEIQEMRYLTLDLKNPKISTIMQAIFEIPAVAGMPVQLKIIDKGDSSLTNHLHAIYHFEKKRPQEELHGSYKFFTTQIEPVKDSDSLWRLPTTYRQSPPGDVIFGAGWKDAASEYLNIDIHTWKGPQPK